MAKTKPDIDHDQAPTAGGSYLRQPDGSLVQVERTKTRDDHAAEQAEKGLPDTVAASQSTQE